MDFAPSPLARQLHERLLAFMDRYLLPYNAAWHAAVQAGDYPPPFLQDLKALAREEGLWNLFLPTLQPDEPGTRLNNLDYAPLAEAMGRLPWAAEVFNCHAPDTGNIELLHRFATPAQRARWLVPLLHGHMRSAFAMSEPDVASSDPTNLQTTVRREGAERSGAAGDTLVLNGRKWFITGAAHPQCQLLIVLCRNADADDSADPDSHHRHSMVLVPVGTPGVEVVRNIHVLHHHAPEGHCEIRLHNVRVPATALLGDWGQGFAMAQARLGPGRVHHCMRTIGQCELALQLAAERTSQCAGVAGRLTHRDRPGALAGAARRLAAGPGRRRATAGARAGGCHQVGGRAAAAARGRQGHADFWRHGPLARHAPGRLLDLGPRPAPDGWAG